MFVLSGLIVGLLAFGLSSFFLAVFIFMITRTKSHFSHLLSYHIPKISVSIVSFEVNLKMIMSLGLVAFSKNEFLLLMRDSSYAINAIVYIACAVFVFYSSAIVFIHTRLKGGKK